MKWDEFLKPVASVTDLTTGRPPEETGSAAVSGTLKRLAFQLGN